MNPVIFAVKECCIGNIDLFTEAKMSAKAALRKPFLNKTTKRLPAETRYVMITLNEGNKKLVVSFDSYNGILSMGDLYKCVVCDKLLDLDQTIKDQHISSSDHCTTLGKYPHADEFSHHLIRNLTEVTSFCTICNVIVANEKRIRHTKTEAHMQELERASIRGLTYTVDQ